MLTEMLRCLRAIRTEISSGVRSDMRTHTERCCSILTATEEKMDRLRFPL